MIQVSYRHLTVSLIVIILLYDEVESGSLATSWSNRYNGHTVLVPRIHTYYRGGGYGLVYSAHNGTSQSNSTPSVQSSVSESSTMSTGKIREVLFNGDEGLPSKKIFDYEENPFRRRHHKDWETDNRGEMTRMMLAGSMAVAQVKAASEGTQPSKAIQILAKAMADAKKDQVVTVKDEKQAVIVGLIPYFFGDHNLPQSENQKECVDFSVINDSSNFTICNVNSLRRCQKSLNDIVVFTREKDIWDTDYNLYSSNVQYVQYKVDVRTSDGAKADHFSWFCPASDDCCEWECCYMETKNYEEYHPPDPRFIGTVHISIVLIAIVAVILLCCCIHRCFIIDDKLSENAHNQSVLDKELLTADYPRQPRGAPKEEGNYGWNLTPSAPPMGE